jgi:hypothetical protein
MKEFTTQDENSIYFQISIKNHAFVEGGRNEQERIRACPVQDSLDQYKLC